MGKIGIFYGSTTGNTETVAEKIQELIGEASVTLHDVESAAFSDLEQYENLIFGIPTWNIGELQEDWEDFIAHIESDKVSLTGKKIAFFGAGDQEGYPDTFGDAIGIVYDIVREKGAETVCDSQSTDGYNFEESKAQRNGKFIGLLTDEDCQPEKTSERVEHFCKDLKAAFNCG